MKKITEISEIRYRTVHEKDAKGNRIRKQVPMKVNRQVNVVSNGRRFAHYLIDLVIFNIIYSGFKYLLSLAPSVQPSYDMMFYMGSISISMTFLFAMPIYYFLFEFTLQRTPGKFITGTRVIDEYANKPNFGTMLTRSIVRMVPFEGFSCLSERGWHDKWSNTYVVKNDEYKKLRELIQKDDTPTQIFPSQVGNF